MIPFFPCSGSDHQAGKEVYTSNFSPEDLLLIIEFIEKNLDEPIFDRPKVQKPCLKRLKGIGYGNNHEGLLNTP
jgi:hypothetical protein